MAARRATERPDGAWRRPRRRRTLSRPRSDPGGGPHGTAERSPSRREGRRGASAPPPRSRSRSSTRSPRSWRSPPKPSRSPPTRPPTPRPPSPRRPAEPGSSARRSSGSRRSCGRSTRREVEANERLRSLSEHERRPSSSPSRWREAEAALTEADDRLVEGSASLQDLAVQRAEAQAVLDVAPRPGRARRRALASPRRSSGTCWPGWPPSEPCASADPCRCCSTTPSRASTRTSSATSSAASSGWPTRCR